MNFDELTKHIRREIRLGHEVPSFDPLNGNEQAWLLLLLEAPGPKAVKTGCISVDNPDPTARNLKGQLLAAGIERSDFALWNIVPWYIGNARQTEIRAANGADVKVGMRYLPPLLEAMPNLSCIALVGGAARQAHVFLSRITTARIVSCHHPSARFLNPHPEAAQENIEIFRLARVAAGKS